MAKYNKVTPEIAEQLKAVVGEKRFFIGDDINPDYSHDEMPIYGKFSRKRSARRKPRKKFPK